MNKRIEDLVAAEMDRYYEGAYHDSACAKDQLRQFAERIIEECAEVASNCDVDGSNYVSEDIETHFGVE